MTKRRTSKGGKKSSRYCDMFFDAEIESVDEDTARLIELEEERQSRKLIMIASESLCPKPVKQALNSVFTNLYSEGLPSVRMDRETVEEVLDYDSQMTNQRRLADRRYYKGCDYVNLVETLAKRRICELYSTHKDPKAEIKLKPEEIYANVQPLSGAIGNNAIYDAFLEIGDTVMGMSLTSGGHLTHGSIANRSGKHYNIVSYEADVETGEMKWKEMERMVREHKPKMIIAGYSAYPLDIDWKRFRKLADISGAILLADVSHIAGLIATGHMNNPIGYADIVMFTTQKTLCGPRGAVILTTDKEKAKMIDLAIFPGEQSGPHQSNIAAKAVSFKIAQTDEFKELQKNIRDNARHLASSFKKLGLKVAYRDSDSHMTLIDLKGIKTKTGYTLTGEVAARILEICGIVCNKNTIPGDDNAIHPTAIRFGTTWLTQRGFGKKHMEKIAELVHKVLTNIQPFHWIGRIKIIGRGKIDLAVMEEVKAEVEKLEQEAKREIEIEWDSYPHYFGPSEDDKGRETALHDVHKKLKAKLSARDGWMLPSAYSNVKEEVDALEKKAGLIDIGDVGILEVSGRRAEEFLDEVGTAKIVGMEEGQSKRTLFLDKDASLMAEGLVIRLKEKKSVWSRFVVLVHAPNTERIKLWFRSLSDAYVIFDERDIFRKIQGPVIVHDLKNVLDEKRRKTAMVLRGPAATKILKAASSKLKSIGEGQSVAGNYFGCRCIISHSGFGKKDVSYTVLVHPKDAEKAWKKLLASGKKHGLIPVGYQSRAQVRKKYGMIPLSGKKLKGKSLVAGYKSLFGFTKPYFIGQPLLQKHGPSSKKKKYRYVPDEITPRKSCLYEEHLKLTEKALIVPFAGWLMPISYGSIAEEHQAVRETAGLFDVSHMGVIEIAGKYATHFLDFVTTNYVHLLYPGQCQYGYVLDPDGNVLDDVFTYCRAKDKYLMVANAVNAEKVLAWFNAVNSQRYVVDNENPSLELPETVSIRDLKDPSSGKDQRIDISLQGPRSLDILLSMVNDETLRRKITQLDKLEFIETKIAGIEMIVSRSGYTGEDIGFEFYLHPKDAPKLWRMILEKGKKFGVKPVALGSRDSTRTEAGFPLWGQELAGDHNIFPSEAGYGFFVRLHKPFFIGRKRAIEKARDWKMQIVRFMKDEKGGRIVRPGNPIVDRKRRTIGRVTSTVVIEGHQIGMAFVERKYSEEGAKIGLIPVPPGKKLSEEEKTKLYKEATILSRFMSLEEQFTKLK
jgi:glycine cleavage system T protein